MTWNPFGRKNDEAQSEQTANDTETAASESKGRPTPKRREAQAKNIHPLVPKNRKAEAKAAKKRMREKEDAQYEAMRTGDIANMPRSERLPWRIYIRDYVDARFNIEEFFIPVMFAALIAEMVVMAFSIAASYIIMIALYVYIIVGIIDLFVMWQGLKKKLIEKYGEKAVAKGMRSCSYACNRAIQLRRWRVPKPRSKKRGDWPK
ncbi:DUF3043 domain-containing protein [Bifidobacterium bombi]|uniref:Integral membrane protein n=1 Tax=Bifidobacterium bombi DSM 19703 TaxID=1341695 RepID=A0A080N4F1_9BIFI|nr:DUF3043 domain-containing protein [Bifidobacterium bombi]KFF31295.1 hypothetical protein BBOMB_0636 [Bifidobacterium bombi DSM 19703]